MSVCYCLKPRPLGSAIARDLQGRFLGLEPYTVASASPTNVLLKGTVSTHNVYVDSHFGRPRNLRRDNDSAAVVQDLVVSSITGALCSAEWLSRHIPSCNYSVHPLLDWVVSKASKNLKSSRNQGTLAGNGGSFEMSCLCKVAGGGQILTPHG